MIQQLLVLGDCAGQVTGLRISPGETVAQGTALCRIVPAAGDELTEGAGDPGRAR